METLGNLTGITLFHWRYWLGDSNLTFADGYIYYFVCGGVCLAAFLVSRYMLVRFKKEPIAKIFYSPFPSGFLSFAVFGILLGFFHYQHMYVFTARIWFLIYQALFFLWFIPRMMLVYGYIGRSEIWGLRSESSKMKKKR